MIYVHYVLLPFTPLNLTRALASVAATFWLKGREPQPPVHNCRVHFFDLNLLILLKNNYVQLCFTTVRAEFDPLNITLTNGPASRLWSALVRSLGSYDFSLNQQPADDSIKPFWFNGAMISIQNAFSNDFLLILF